MICVFPNLEKLLQVISIIGRYVKVPEASHHETKSWKQCVQNITRFRLSKCKIWRNYFFMILKSKSHYKIHCFWNSSCRKMRRIVLSFSSQVTLSFVGVSQVLIKAWRNIFSLLKHFRSKIYNKFENVHPLKI